MATTVGAESDLNRMLTHLVKLELDALAAYDAAVDRIDEEDTREKLEGFMDEHRRQAEELCRFLIDADQPIPVRGDLKRWLMRGRVMLADFRGDRAILRALRATEDDAAQAYGRAVNHPEAVPSLRDILRRGMAEERRHHGWLTQQVEARH